MEQFEREVLERITALETRMHAVEKIDGTFVAQLAVMNTKLESINSRLDKQRGFIGGIVFIVSGVWAVIIGIASVWKGIH